MSPDTDAVLTFAGFILAAVPVALVLWVARGVVRLSNGGADDVVTLIAVGVPVGGYLTALVLAIRSSGPTFYYPLIVLGAFAVCFVGIVAVFAVASRGSSTRPAPKRRRAGE
ncbi:hypothetical protein [Mycobacterium talmoniae]|uniref:Uncharacterized protein n=1 Tax=Mycobacterium talmoniae TaxID=1858794 RepID=A0A1S1NLX6_9MYCO|nr:MULTISPECIES: hypothetical protein [Mycobacterium]OHV05661.1 hypothetical protein BKN37_04940 [Mycobacterium talmoniae]TDH52046.1 hypothetical protein E2F47_14735 [Mycobacterium eburneum]